MRFSCCRSIVLLVAVVALTIFARQSHGQITGIITSDAEGFFGSISDGYQQSEPPISPTWPAVGFAPPYPPSGLPAGSVPPLYGAFPSATFPVPNTASPFPAPVGHAPGSPFTDGTTSADYHIYGGIAGAGTYTRNAYVRLGNNTGTLMYLDQPSTATGYAYEEVEFAIDYDVGPGGLLAGNPPNLRPYLVFGNFLTGGQAEFGAQVNYSYATVNFAGVVGAFSSLGTLQYQDYINSVTGPFVNLVNDTSFAAPNLLGAVGNPYGGVLELTGDMYLIGDPGFDISAEAVPEPSSIVLLGVGMLGLVLLATRRMKRLACPIC